jgi:hypothetical protein
LAAITKAKKAQSFLSVKVGMKVVLLNESVALRLTVSSLGEDFALNVFEPVGKTQCRFPFPT